MSRFEEKSFFFTSDGNNKGDEIDCIVGLGTYLLIVILDVINKMLFVFYFGQVRVNWFLNMFFMVKRLMLII